MMDLQVDYWTAGGKKDGIKVNVRVMHGVSWLTDDSETFRCKHLIILLSLVNIKNDI